MVKKDFGGVEVDVCVNGCKGIWFECGELAQLDEKNEGTGQALKEALESERTIDQNRGKLDCPKCGIPMQIHKYKHCKDVNVDECYSCGGIFLDSGELKAIKEGFMSPKERDEYAAKLASPYESKTNTRKSQHSQAIGQLRDMLSFWRIF
jgi:hypothetical protein